MRRFLLAFVVVLLLAPPVAAQDEVPSVDAATYLSLFDDATLRGVERPADEVYDLFIDITGNADTDRRIRMAAEDRGYRRQPIATASLVPVDGRELQAPAAEAWLAMKAQAQAEGVSLILTSAFRDLDGQAQLFRGRLAGQTSDFGIESALQFSAPPGYSRHHSGFAIDIGQAGETRGGFINTQAYAWLSADDFAAAKAFGFIPSYPEDGTLMGPDPEPWELVWVGTGRIACAVGANFLTGFCDVVPGERSDDVAWLVDLGVTVGCAPERYCPDDAVRRGEAASMLWRLHGAPETDLSAPFLDVYPEDHFAEAVAWLWSVDVVQGTSDDTFSPDELLAPEEAFALVIRLKALGLTPHGVDRPVADFAAAPLVIGDLGAQVSRGEFASVLRAVVAA
ncbi:MAG: D-alanyl-D-alanine carboxypeptidase [Candidatus Aldehydirespiratoraceae bacterium]